MADAFPELVTMGRASAARYVPGDREVAISIRSRGEVTPTLHERFLDRLWLDFDDDQFDGWRERGRTISERDADLVVSFVEAYRFTARRIVIHCGVGISRSASMAKALGMDYRAPVVHLDAAGEPFSIPRILNRGVYVRVREAYARRMARHTPTPAAPETGL